MRRRDLFLAPWWAPAAFGQPQASQARPPGNKPREWMTAAASRDTVSRIGLIPSTFTGNVESDGRKIRALTHPAPLMQPLSADQLDDMLQLAVELGGGRRGGLTSAIRPDDWVLIKISIRSCPGGAQPFHPGAVTDPRLVAGLLGYLARSGLGRRFTIAEGAPCRPAGAASLWNTTWDNQFDGLSYRSLVETLSRKHPQLRFELLDLNGAPSLPMPVEGRVLASHNPKGMYFIPRVLRECDKVISIAPLATMDGSGVALSFLNYLGFAPADHYGYPKNGLFALGEPGEIALDLFSFHPADYAIAGGSYAAESDPSTPGATRMRRHNVIIAGTSALAVDTVGAAVMGFEPNTIRHLELAVRRGYGSGDTYSIWTRGVEIDEVRADFQKPGVANLRGSRL
ncbi:MAG: DUF362 domain-containing protein [Bryobacterales bacterium]|nr:DUF362 domain-containing protein [Bryobacterales bacterium]